MSRDLRIILMVGTLTSSVWLLVLSGMLDRQTAELVALTERVREAERLAYQAVPPEPPEADPLRPYCDALLQFTLDDHRTVVKWLDDLDENTRNQELQLAEGGIDFGDAGWLIRANYESFLPGIRVFAELGVEHGEQTQDCFALGIIPDWPQYVPGEQASVP
jgi:hypothetical protein